MVITVGLIVSVSWSEMMFVCRATGLNRRIFDVLGHMILGPILVTRDTSNATVTEGSIGGPLGNIRRWRIVENKVDIHGKVIDLVEVYLESLATVDVVLRPLCRCQWLLTENLSGRQLRLLSDRDLRELSVRATTISGKTL